MDHQPWRSQATCRNLSPEESDAIFFVGVGHTVKRAKIFCSSCPVKQECLNYAILYNEEGFLAGTTKDERDAMAPFVRDNLYRNAILNGTLETRKFEDWGLPTTLDQKAPTPTMEELPPLYSLPERSPFETAGLPELAASAILGLPVAQ